MKKERDIMLLAMIINLLIAFVKLSCGVLFNFSSLIADSLHSFSDFITDIISMIASKVGRKRANKKYPFGYGMAENIANLLIGIVLFVLAIYIFVGSFSIKDITLTPTVFIVLVVTIGLKLFVVCYLYFKAKELNNNSLLVSAKESSTDLISSAIVLFVSILLLLEKYVSWFKYADAVGSLLISLIVFNISIKIIIQNIEYLLGINDNNEEIIKAINDIIDNNRLIKGSSIKLIKMGNYYNLYLLIELDDNVTLKKLFNLEKKLKMEIRKTKYKIKFIEIEPIEYKG